MSRSRSDSAGTFTQLPREESTKPRLPPLRYPRHISRGFLFFRIEIQPEVGRLEDPEIELLVLDLVGPKYCARAGDEKAAMQTASAAIAERGCLFIVNSSTVSHAETRGGRSQIRAIVPRRAPV